MTQLATFNLGDGHTVVAEVDEHHTFAPGVPSRQRSSVPAEGSAPVSRRGAGRDPSEDLGNELAGRLDQIRATAATVLRVLKDAASPDEIKLSLGVKLSQEAGVVIARTAMEGNMTVELVWKRPPAGNDPQ